jgi:lathosterol oxidase
MPVNIDLLFAMYGFVFYFYGVYLHSGYEIPGLSAHNPIINTSFQGH